MIIVKKIEVVEGYNDKNKITKNDPNHDKVEEENLEEYPTHEGINVLQVVAHSMFEIKSFSRSNWRHDH